MNYIDQIAQEIAAQTSDDVAGDPKQMDLFRVYAVLALVRGTGVTARDVHNAWSAWTASEDPTHESLVPFDQLSKETQQEDSPYVRAIRTVSGRRGLESS